MRLITIEEKNGGSRIINTEQISSIYKDNQGDVAISLSHGLVVTKFTDIEHAADYVRRAATLSLVAK